MGAKPARRNAGVGVQREDTSPKMFGMSAGHLIGDRVHMTARCGKPLSGWMYGALPEVRCEPCKEALA